MVLYTVNWIVFITIIIRGPMEWTFYESSDTLQYHREKVKLKEMCIMDVKLASWV